jgi:hypothetical protein
LKLNRSKATTLRPSHVTSEFSRTRKYTIIIRHTCRGIERYRIVPLVIHRFHIINQLTSPDKNDIPAAVADLSLTKVAGVYLRHSPVDGLQSILHLNIMTGSFNLTVGIAVLFQVVNRL